MAEYIFGANILENLTTGMYQDSKVIYREYIQNACDQIDKAVIDGILSPGEGKIDIWLDYDKRIISIEDNATGISANTFERVLGNIADSDKKIGEDKGFRGIGRLCGLAYCRELVFSSSVKGEDTISFMYCNALKMRELLNENVHGKKHTANDVLHAINKFERKTTADIDSHFFKVDLIDINPENTDLLDFQQIKDYLSFIAPVPYQNSFFYRSEIYKHAKNIGARIDEYTVNHRGEPIFKKYTTILKDPSGNKYDDIFGVHFMDFYDKDGQLFAWLWVGLSKFQKAIPKINQMRGLRLRKENIQIGGEDSLQKLFKEDRGNSYFIGEVFAIDKDLIPNSQRDYFNENPARAVFERELKKYFNDELKRIYYDGSAINSSYKKIESYEKKEADFCVKETAGFFVNKEHHERELNAVLVAKKVAETEQIKIERIKDKADPVMQQVINRIEVTRPKPAVTMTTPPPDMGSPDDDTKPTRRTDRLSQYSKSERKLISKIFSIIFTATDNDNAEYIVSKIEEGPQ